MLFRSVPASLTQACPHLTPLPDGADFGGLLAAAVEAAGMYRTCAVRHAGLARAVE